MNRLLLKSGLITCLIFALMCPLQAHVRNQIFVGARPQGLGETFVAIADDGNAVYWNPAGLTTLKRFEFNSMYTNLYNIPGMQNLYLSLVYPLSPRFTVGGSWMHFGAKDEELEFVRQKIHLALGAKLYGNLSLGGNIKYIDKDVRGDGFTEADASGFGLDVGLLYTLSLPKLNFLKQLNFGLMLQDVSGTSVTYKDTDKSEEIFPQNIRFGMAILAPEAVSLKWFSLRDALVAIEFSDRFHLGAEAWLFNVLGLRAGIQKDWQTEEPLSYSFGTSIRFPVLSSQLDYSYLTPPTLHSENIFAFSFTRSFSPVRITDVNINDLFASFYKTYATRPIGSATVRNDYDEPLDLTLKVSIPDLVESESYENFRLEPEEQRSLSFTAVFVNDILNQKETGFRQAELTVVYKIKGEEKLEETAAKFRLFGRGAITWDHPAKAVAFITKLDRMVELFALAATKSLPFKSELELGNLHTAAALFNAMRAIGIKYRRDPVNPFALIPKTQHSVDYIKYPAELLQEKQGECDDLTVLYASLLENAGIRTALLSTDRHITLMFDSGIHVRNWGVLPLGDSLIVRKEKSLWIPVEVTEVNNSFAKAWQVGGKRYREAAKARELEVVMVRDFEGSFLSALPEELQTQIPDLPDEHFLNELITNDLAWIEQQRTDAAIRRYLAELAQKPADITLRNKFGIVLAQLDSITPAENQFKEILNQSPQHPQALNNLANIHFINGNFQEAETAYLNAVKSLENEPGVYLNLAILYQILKFHDPADSSRFQAESEKYLFRAFELLKGNEVRALDLLAISAEELEFAPKEDFKSWLKEQATALKKFIKRNTQKFLFNKTVKGARVEGKAVKRGKDEDRRFILWWANEGG